MKVQVTLPPRKMECHQLRKNTNGMMRKTRSSCLIQRRKKQKKKTYCAIRGFYCYTHLIDISYMVKC